MAIRKSGPLDAMVGAKIRIFRINRGISQAGASRLAQIASVLGISVGELFEPSGNGSAGLNSPVHLLAEPGALRVLKAYVRTTDPRVRLSIAKLIESIADGEPPAKAPVARLNVINRGEPGSIRARG